MRKTFVAALALVSTCSVNALEIKGLKIGQPVDCASIKALETRSGTFSDACNNGRPSWYTETEFLNGKAMLRLTQSPDRVLLSVAVGESVGFNFEEALDALTVKFGAPTLIDKSVIQNRMGASFDQIEATWVDGDETLVLRKHGASIGRPYLLYSGKKAAEEAKWERAEKAKKAAGNL